ncbi:MAG: ATP-grasp domain-containing protein [Eubacteriales bacterium]|nr:ATP-grasp domain-containing protein [Eubacteriales bacterium]
MKKLMILGASYSQLPLIQAAKRLGVYTIAASTPGDWPGFFAADEMACVDIASPDEVVREGKKRNIDGVATCCLDAGMASIGALCQAMGLPGPTREAALLASDKYRMKEAFRREGVVTAAYRCVKSREELEKALGELSFPVILKAVDLMGSRGIFRCDSREEALRNYERTMEATRRDYCLVEEFIQGTLFGAEAMVKDGRLLYFLADNTESLVTPEGIATPVGHSLPFEEEAALGSLVRKRVERAIRALGLDNCPVNCDLIRRGNQVYVVELTGRAGGTCLPELVGACLGIDYYEAIVRLALDMEVEVMFLQKKGHPAALSHILGSSEGGVVRAIHQGDLGGEDILDLSFNISPGDQIRPYTNGRDRIGQVILAGDTLEGCRRRLREILGKISIEFEG